MVNERPLVSVGMGEGLLASVGFKLPLGPAEDPAWKAAFGSVKDMHGFLADLGFCYAEYPVGSLEDPREVQLFEDEARSCARRGMGVALHPYFGREVNAANFDSGPGCRNALCRVLDCASGAASITGRPVVAVFHPAGGPFDPAVTTEQECRSSMMRQSRLFLSELEKRAASLPAEVLVVIEHQVPPSHAENVVRIGDTYEELLEAVRGTGLPLCWDTGHYLRSVAVWGQPVDPSEGFVRRVAHVHLHDVVNGRDHCPISEGSGLLAGYMQRLRGVGFRGSITLEYSPEDIEGAGGLEKVAPRSMALLREWARAGVEATGKGG